MSISITKRQLREVISAQPLTQDQGDTILGLGLEFDSREIKGGEIFIALAGERTHGHQFLSSAAERGASLFIVEDAAAAQLLPQERVLVVSSSQQALYTLATWWRTQLQVPTIAVTGSVGKTTIKELLRYTLGVTGRGTWSLKSHNNHVGVPYTILRSSREDNWLVLEMGMNHPGELAVLSRCAKPDIAIVSMVAPAHIGNFDGIESIAAEKLSIVQGLCTQEGVLIVNADCDPLMECLHKNPPPCKIYYYGKAREVEVDQVTTVLTHTELELEFRVKLFAEIEHVRLKTPSRVNAHNAAAALLAAKLLNPLLHLKELIAGLSQFSAPEMRLVSIPLSGGRVLIDDSYNANPTSMMAALEVARDYVHAGKRVAVMLGEMLELGTLSQQYHEQIGQAAAGVGLVGLIVVGDVGAWYQQGALRQEGELRILKAQTPEEAALVARELSFDVLLVKGSRGAKLDGAVKAIAQQDMASE